MMKKRLSPAQWKTLIASMDASDQSLAMAHAVLVEGRAQAVVAAECSVTASAVSQTITRFWRSHLERSSRRIPHGFRRVTVLLPEREALLVESLARTALHVARTR